MANFFRVSRPETLGQMREEAGRDQRLIALARDAIFERHAITIPPTLSCPTKYRSWLREAGP